MKYVTLQDRLNAFDGIGPGFDALRILLSTSVILWHSVYICYGGHSVEHDAVTNHFLSGNLLRGLLPMFFALSGFLVCGSALRLKKTRVFLTFRALRMIPALLTEVLICAIILGAVYTTLPLRDYYTVPQFFAYFKNIIGFIEFYLPGVFTDSPTSVVSVNLWTLPYEFWTYIILAVAMVMGVVLDRKNFMFLFVFATTVIIYALASRQIWDNSVEGHLQPWLIMYSFFVGVVMYLYADRIPFAKTLAALSIAGMFFLKTEYAVFAGVISACYLTVYIGLCRVPRLPLFKRGDYSYGLYLYGFPIAQMIWHSVPVAREWWSLFMLSYPCTLLFSMASWRFIEKPCLQLKNKIAYMKRPEPISPTQV